ncbi:hypothetical protein [Mycobacterium ostraviense]|uniref:Uncharacterized protein n=1 Tax=Mycobacterium ostraviense TaxID=2738409 RepID=A0A163X590_9MYCO|nr:hypothetical protein [Mycobacterium ostraviense]KZS58995.1 hypothetical protein A4G28_15100 [Mycobacterium ostraviense]
MAADTSSAAAAAMLDVGPAAAALAEPTAAPMCSRSAAAIAIICGSTSTYGIDASSLNDQPQALNANLSAALVPGPFIV